MKFRFLTVCSLLLSLLLLGGIMVACGGDEEETADSAPEESSDEKESGDESETESDTDETKPPVVLTGTWGSAITHAHQIANGVQASYMDSTRNHYRVENQNMVLEYALAAADQPMVSALKNSKGDVYVANTMDAFVKMNDGNVYYASNTTTAARPNIFKYGYYYYEVHFLEQNFIAAHDVSAEKEFPVRLFQNLSADASNRKFADDTVSFTVSGGDPYIYTGESPKFSAATYNAIEISIRSDRATSATLYFLAGSATGHSDAQSVNFALIPDGEFHAYTVFLSGVSDYTGMVSRLRLDLNDAAVGDVIAINGLRALKAESKVPPIVFDRTLHAYSDKLNQALHFIAKDTVTGISEFGMSTTIPADTVDKLIVGDAKGTHTSLDDVDWTTAVYVGFDIKSAGVFGYILPVHENSGKLTVALADGHYIITQSASPEDGILEAMGSFTENDFFMGQRLYTDETHTFDAFLREAEYERNPLTVLGGDTYVGYDALRGAYEYGIGGTGFNPPFFTSWNRHYEADVTIKGTDTDRQIYIYSNCPSNGGCTEGAVLLDENGMQLPIPMMIFKNFGGEDEEPIFYHGDQAYSMTLFPMTIDAGVDKSFTILNAMQNWGAFPLKQLSSIQFYAPYYHLSTGVTETSCIAPWYVHGKSLWTLPDFRPMSGIWWFDYEDDRRDNQPQHTHAGYHYFLQYTDADGNRYASENIENTIVSSGLNYSEVIMDYISDDGKIKVSYNHIEMPQTDEHRAYYEITYEVLEDVKIQNFQKDFSFFSTQGYAGLYQKMGYLNEKNEIVHINTPKRGFIQLGDQCPYVSFYALSGAWENKCGNTGFMIYNADLCIGGETYKGNLGLYTDDSKHHLTLNLGEVTLKKGDKMSINMVIVPWGSEESTDDTNMIKLRENTGLCPLDVTVANGEKLASVFVPRVKSVNGKDAELTLTGGTNHSVVRVYGFEKLTAPKIYEKINGEWVEYVSSSANTPDLDGTVHDYDGYCVYYDGDGTYSYTFLVDMTDVSERTFKIDASEDFQGWPAEPENEKKDPLNVYSDPTEIKSQIIGASVGESVVAEDGSYIRIYGDGTSPEAYFTTHIASNGEATGQYLVFKYRYPGGKSPSDIQIYTSTANNSAIAEEYFTIHDLTVDDNWHIMVVDMSKQGLPTFEAAASGKYVALHIRMDIFNAVTATDQYIDLAYIGVSDQLEAICQLNSDMEAADVCTNGAITATLNLQTGKVIPLGEEDSDKPATPLPDNDADFIHSDSGKAPAALAYIARIDFVNGVGDGEEGSPQYDSKGASNLTKIDVLAYNAETVDGHKLALAGWAMVYGGIEKYVWSADGGKTWHDATLYNRDTIQNASEGIIRAAEGGTATSGFDEFTANAVFQGAAGIPSGICADLSAYAGETVQVTFAAVPVAAPDALCIIVSISGVKVVD